MKRHTPDKNKGQNGLFNKFIQLTKRFINLHQHMHYKKNLLLIIVAILASQCASTIQSIGKFSDHNPFSSVEIQCITPVRLYKYSNELCYNIKSNIERSDLSVSVNVKDEMTPSLKSSDQTDLRKGVLILEVTHERVSVGNTGKPFSTLMNISARLSPKKESLWAARVQTEGNSITGPTNPEKVAIQIINQMKADGFDF